MHIEVDLTRCVDCKNCMLICSFFNEKSFTPSLARIKVMRRGYNTFSWHVCQQHEKELCRQSSCIKACPKGAITKRGGRIIIDYELCDGCGKCVEACKYGAIFIHPKLGKPTVCVLCLNCVRNCKREALRIYEGNVDVTERVIGGKK